MKKKIITFTLSFSMIAGTLPCTASSANGDIVRSWGGADIAQNLNTNSFRLPSRDNVIEINHNNTIEDIVSKEMMYKHGGFDNRKTRYTDQPSLTAPYKAGSLNQDDLDDAVNAIKMVRFLAGTPYEDVRFDPELNDIAQHGSVILAASGQFTHQPFQPSDMDNEFYELAYRGCSESNIYYGINNISYGILGWVYDGGDNNIERAGHRRWILNPGNQNFGIGYAEGKSNLHVFDGMGPWDCEFDSYIAWPAAGDFPIQYFAANDYIDFTIKAPWSINLGAPYNTPYKENISLQLTRKRDGKVWIFNENTPNLSYGGYDNNNNMHLSVNGGGYGINKAIIFRPDLDSLGKIEDGDIFNIKLTGIEYIDGTPAELSYDINFFDLEEALTKRQLADLEANQIMLTIGKMDAKVFGKTKSNDVAPKVVNNRTMLPARFVAENLGANVEWFGEEQKVRITKDNIEILIFIGSDKARVNDKEVILDSPAFIENNHTYTPIRFIAEELGATVEWDEITKSVIITKL